MALILVIQISLCLITLGTVIPTVYLGLKIPPVDRPVFFGISGLSIGVIFIIANIISGPVFSSLWGLYAWISMLTLLGFFFYISHCLKFSLKQALRINFFMQVLLLSAIPMSNLYFYNISTAERLMIYLMAVLSFAFVIINSSLLLLSYIYEKRLYYSGIYTFTVLILLIAFEPFTETSPYIEFINKLSINSGSLSFRLSLLFHLVVIPLISFIPFIILKHFSKIPPKLEI